MTLSLNLKMCGMLALCVGLSGCGGGGDGAAPAPSPAPAPAPAPAPVVLDPLTSVPSPTYGDTRVEAFSRINEIRRQVGLGLLAQNAKLDVAAQGHTEYLALNPMLSHFQTEGLPGFTGKTAIDRAIAAGYAAGEGGQATIGEALSTEDLGANLINSIDEFLDAPYHRISFLNHASIDIGIGLKPVPRSSVAAFVIDFGYHRGRMQGAPKTPFVVWPQPNTVISRLDTYPYEVPAPPGRGYAPSIHVDPSRVLKVKSFEMRDASGVVVPAAVLTQASDPNMWNKPYAAILSPVPVLTAATSYTVRFDGSSNDEPLTFEWSFRTP